MNYSKSKKHILSLILTLCILLAGLGTSQTVSAAQDKTPDYQKAYQKVLNNKKKVFKIGKKEYKRKAYKYYTFVDINEDGIEEMILSKEKGPFLSEDAPALVLTYIDGKVKAVKEVSQLAGARVLINNKRLVMFNRCAGESHLEVYALTSEGKVKKKLTLDHYQPHHYKVDTAKDVYLRDGKKCTEKEYMKLWDKYYQNELTFKKIKTTN